MSGIVAGVDEAGRGPLAGPVVAAAVILRPGCRIRGVTDSKVLSAETRAELNLVIRRRALCFGIGWADPAEIDSLNILHATFLAMRRAVLALTLCPDELWVDGNRLPRLSGLGGALTARAIIGGDAKKLAISAASILAKTARDSYMDQMHTMYPSYGFLDHKGYATAQHRRALFTHGPCPLHRRSFAPVELAYGALANGTLGDAALLREALRGSSSMDEGQAGEALADGALSDEALADEALSDGALADEVVADDLADELLADIAADLEIVS